MAVCTQAKELHDVLGDSQRWTPEPSARPNVGSWTAWKIGGEPQSKSLRFLKGLCKFLNKPSKNPMDFPSKIRSRFGSGVLGLVFSPGNSWRQVEFQ